jgi:hypothetical protein
MARLEVLGRCRRPPALRSQSSSAACSVGAMSCAGAARARSVADHDERAVAPAAFQAAELHAPPPLPAVHVGAPLDRGRPVRHLQRIPGVQHDGDLVGARRRLAEHVLQRLRVRAVGEAAGMQRDHAGMNVVAREELARVIEQHLVVIVVVVEERHLQRVRGRSRTGAARKVHTTKRPGHEGRVDRRRQMIAVRHQRPDITPVDAHGHEVALPAHRVERVVGIGDHAHLLATLHLHAPLALVLLGEKRSSIFGVSSIASSKMACGPSRPLSGRR